jgi:two-component system, OmpR family, sensor kinase
MLQSRLTFNLDIKKSLRWKLLTWYAVILSGLACVFGGLLYANVRRTIQQEVDAALHAHAVALADVILPVGRGKFQIELTPEQVEAFSDEGAAAIHFAIFTADGQAVDFSHPSLLVPAPGQRGSRNRGPYREVSVRGPAGAWVVVGKGIGRERAQLQNLAAIAVGAGLAALALMLAGGWFLTGRALAPIERISRAASSVSASNLSERIDVTRMETELADLAATINDAFDRLQAAFEQQTRFTADASHELRTPLSIVISHADLALKKERTPDEYRELLATIRRASLRMKGVVEGLLTLARADAGNLRLEKEKLDLRPIVEETCSLLRPIAAEKRVEIVRDLATVCVVGDRERLSEAVANLLTNAVRYNREGGRVEVALRTEQGDAVLEIADTGPGIPEAERPHIFDRFYRVDKARSGSEGGSGLGLAITKWIVDVHGGTIDYASGENGGAVFTIRLAAAANLGRSM